jgi:hypothetical protein
LAFSIIINNHNANSSEMKQEITKFFNLLVKL